MELKKIVYSLGIFSLLLNLVFFSFAVSHDVFDDLYLSIDERVRDAQINGINETNNPNSPYSLIKDNKYYRKITSKGIKFLPDIYNELENQENSMYAYILSLAIEDIIDVDLKKVSYNWDSSISFQPVFKMYLNDIERKTKNVLESNLSMNDKKHKISKLGQLAFAYIKVNDTFNEESYQEIAKLKKNNLESSGILEVINQLK